jgi:RNA polymerase sigma-70 factor (ECF subfamily)
MTTIVEERATLARQRLVAAMLLAGRGDAAGLRDVYDLTSAKLFGICLRICGDREAAEDVLQDVYVRVWRRAAAFDAERASPISWLAVIARNAALDWRRASRRHEAMPEEALFEVADDSLAADDLLLQDETRARLMICLDGLEPNQSETIKRAFLEGFTYQQLAERTETPLGTIKSWIRRGMQKLKDCLGDD